MSVEGRLKSSLHRAAPVSVPAAEARGGPKQPHLFYDTSKRLTDVVAASALLVLALPVLLLASIAILITTRRNPLLFQRRVGLHGLQFTMLKLRTMHEGRVECHDLAAKAADDPRITRIGVVLRRTSVDELPQLINVLLGQMSLVGPRPALPEEVALYHPGWRRRLDVMPGLTGLWQVSGRSAVSVERWMALDRCYLQKRSLPLDAAVLFRTIGAVVTMRGAW